MDKLKKAVLGGNGDNSPSEEVNFAAQVFISFFIFKFKIT